MEKVLRNIHGECAWPKKHILWCCQWSSCSWECNQGVREKGRQRKLTSIANQQCIHPRSQQDRHSTSKE